MQKSDFESVTSLWNALQSLESEISKVVQRRKSSSSNSSETAHKSTSPLNRIPSKDENDTDGARTDQSNTDNNEEYDEFNESSVITTVSTNHSTRVTPVNRRSFALTSEHIDARNLRASRLNTTSPLTVITDLNPYEDDEQQPLSSNSAGSVGGSVGASSLYSDLSKNELQAIGDKGVRGRLAHDCPFSRALQSDLKHKTSVISPSQSKLRRLSVHENILQNKLTSPRNTPSLTIRDVASQGHNSSDVMTPSASRAIISGVDIMTSRMQTQMQLSGRESVGRSQQSVSTYPVIWGYDYKMNSLLFKITSIIIIFAEHVFFLIPFFIFFLPPLTTNR